MNVKSYDTLYTEMQNNMIANQNKVTDFNEGSVIRTMFESVARVVESAYVDTRDGYKNVLKELAYSIFNFQPKTGSRATSSVIFSRTKATATKSTIPTGTQVSAGSLIYYTTEIGEILPNELNSNEIPVVAANIGTEYNIGIGIINTFDTSLSIDITSVKNVTRAEGGSNKETDIERLSRFKKYLNGLQGTNQYGFESSILSVDGVRSIAIEEKFPPYLNIYNVICYIDDGTGNLTDSLKNEIIKKIEGDIEGNKNGCKATGIQVLVSPASPVYTSIDVTVKTYRKEEDAAIADVTNAILKEINSLTIGKSVYLSSLILCLRSLSFVKDVSDITIDGEATNLNINNNQIARITSDQINVTVIDVKEV